MPQRSIDWRTFGVPLAPEPRPLTPPSLPGLVAVAAIAAMIVAMLGCCLLSMHITARHDAAAALDRDIARARHEVAALDREVAVRSRLAEVDRWNATLALGAPRADQYLADAAALAAYAPVRAR